MEVLEIRPARVSAALVAIGDMLVSSPIGAEGPRPPRWLGAVSEHIIVEQIDGKKVDDPAAWRQWRLLMVNGQNTETVPIPADGWVWVHLPIVDGPAPARHRPASEAGLRGKATSPEAAALEAAEVGLTEAGQCVVDGATGWCSTHERLEG